MIVKQLNHLIKSHDLEQQEKITQAFQEYEKERRPFISQIQLATMKSHLWNQQEWTRYGEQVYNREFTP
jgi:2-polyprenyl-6-methoxyphenol hydroxylase-like FAD-dependent oxidoreductase